MSDLAHEMFEDYAHELIEAKAEVEKGGAEAQFWQEKVDLLEELFEGKKIDVTSETGDPVLDEILRRRRLGENVSMADVIKSGVR